MLKWYKAALEESVAGSCGFLNKNLTAGVFLVKAAPVFILAVLATGGMGTEVPRCGPPGAVRYADPFKVAAKRDWLAAVGPPPPPDG